MRTPTFDEWHGARRRCTLPGMFRRFRHHPPRPAVRPASTGRIRRMGLRRTLEMLEAGERINDRLYRWTVTEPRAVALRPALA